MEEKTLENTGAEAQQSAPLGQDSPSGNQQSAPAGQIPPSEAQQSAPADLKSMSLEELERYITGIGEKKYRAAQLFSWMHQKQAADFGEMSNLPEKLRVQLADTAVYTVLKPLAVQTSRLDGTKKYLFRLGDGNVVESVFMEYRHGNTVCISSQAGCRMGCVFCASAIGGLIRSLTAAEMLEQVYRIGVDTGTRISNIVVMGTGEPLDNYENLLRFLRLVTDKNGAAISWRGITVSTCGLVPQMERLAAEKLQITLALSLHAPTQEKRQKLMPVANAYPLEETIEACRHYFALTGRRISFEYCLIQGENDANEDADALAALIKGINCHVNLIPANPVKERDWRASGPKRVRAFQSRLEKHGINVTVRRRLGQDIDGACGQLRRKYYFDGLV